MRAVHDATRLAVSLKRAAGRERDLADLAALTSAEEPE